MVSDVIEATSSSYSVTFRFSISQVRICVLWKKTRTTCPSPPLLKSQPWLARSAGHDEDDDDGPGRAADRPARGQDPHSSRHGSCSSREVSGRLCALLWAHNSKAVSSHRVTTPRGAKRAPIRTAQRHGKQAASHSAAKLPRTLNPPFVRSIASMRFKAPRRRDGRSSTLGARITIVHSPESSSP
jgi:hypothetical protein